MGINMAKFSPELTFIPRAAPHEITSKKRGADMVANINAYLQEHLIGRLMMAKLDPHHFPGHPEKETYSVEIIPLRYFETAWLNKKAPLQDGETVNDWGLFKDGINEVFLHLRHKFGLVPSFSRRAKDGSILYWPGGGCHIHYDADQFSIGTNWYERMKAFHTNLAVDFANRPYIRWLFSQWFTDEESSGGLCIITEQNLSDKEIWGDINPLAITAEQVFLRTIRHSSCIEPRFMGCYKGSYLTFEFRMFSMVEDAEELGHIARFTEAWVNSLVKKTYEQEIVGNARGLQVIITRDQLAAMARIPSSRRICREFIESLGLNWKDYLPFYERHYINRIRFGKMV